MKKKGFISDILAGLTVSFAALALGAAFGVMSGRGAFAGMIAAAVIPIITGIFGGTRLSVSGPTAPMTAVSSLIIAFAYDQFQGDKVLAEQFITLVFFLTGICLLVAALLRTGKYIRYVPQVIVLGFMSGIAMLIWVDQIKTLFGWGNKTAPAGSTSINIFIALTTFALILLLPRLIKLFKLPKSVNSSIPYTLTVIILMTVVTSLFNVNVGKIDLGVSLESFSDFFGHIAAYFPSTEIFSVEYILMALPYSLELTLLCYLDLLLTALIMDHLTKDKSDMNKELFGQGLANGVAAIFQGIPGAQATIRSVLLFKEGAKSRLSVFATGVFVLLGFVVFIDYVTLITSAVFIGVLFKAALDVFEKEFISVYLKRKWFFNRVRNYQILFIIYTMMITVIVDLNVAVISGTLLFYLLRKPLRFHDIEHGYAEAEVQQTNYEQDNWGGANNEMPVNFQSNGNSKTSNTMTSYQKLLSQNKEWVQNKLNEDKDFFNRLANIQTPEFLWIGCSDSRVPANEITGTNPGEIFVHRNIANMVVHTDMNMLSVLDYAVNVLHIKHVIVCGHYGCGGVRAAMSSQQFGLIDNWLRNIKDVFRLHEDELNSIADPIQRENRFVELNVIEQVNDLSKTSIIQNSWQTRGGPYLHGWVYDIKNGEIKDLQVSMNNNEEVSAVYRFAPLSVNT
jgi:MFS superfamily sulfate permease-like transporter